MVKFDLREQGFAVQERKQSRDVIGILWVVFTIGFIAFTLLSVNWFFTLIMGYDAQTLSEMRADYWFPLLVDSSVWNFIIILILVYFIYLGLKLIMTISVCSDKFRSIKLKLLKQNSMPVCHCREALTVRQTVFIYLVPLIIVYFALYALCIASLSSFIVLMVMCVLSFFLAFDLTLVVYILYIKARHKIDYVALDHHIYEITTYKNTYVNIGGKSAKRDIKNLEHKHKKRMYEHITTCLNMACENYTVELNKKICPACGDKTYDAAVLANVVTCVNPACENYSHELRQEISSCSLCGKKTGKLAFKFDRDLTKPSVIMSVTAAAGFCLIHIVMAINGMDYVPYLKFGTYGTGRGLLIDILNLIEIITFGIAVIIGFLSKDRKAFIISVISVLSAILFINIVL